MSNLFNYLTNTGSNAAGSTPLGGAAGLGLSGLNSLNTLNQTGSFKDAGQSFFGIDKDDSDVKQGIKGTINGAMKGSAFGPIGAAAGAVLGLGSSFLDDL